MVMALDKMPALSDYGAIIAQFLPFVVLIVVFYFFLILSLIHIYIPHSWGTAVNVQSMVFGNMGETSGTGVASVSYTHLDVYKRQIIYLQSIRRKRKNGAERRQNESQRKLKDRSFGCKENHN